MIPVYWEVIFCGMNRVAINESPGFVALSNEHNGLKYYGFSRHDQNGCTKETVESGQAPDLLNFSALSVGDYHPKMNQVLALQMDEGEDWLNTGTGEGGFLYHKYDFDSETFEIWRMPQIKGTPAAIEQIGIITNIGWRYD